MCGHVGVAGNLDTSTMAVFKDLLYMDALRGRHGTGVVTVPWMANRRDEFTVNKMPIPAEGFMRNSAVQTQLRSSSHSVVIGHNRHATQGAHTYENTHPFWQGNIVGAHNGTVTTSNLRNLKDVDEDFMEFGTDSEALINTIDNIGAVKTIEALYGERMGAWALVWYDLSENTINFVRNNQRPLYYIKSKDEKQLVWASDQFMLCCAISRQDSISFDLTEIEAFDTDFVYSWVVPKGNGIFNPKVTKQKAAPKKPKAVVKATNTRGTSGAYKSNVSRLPYNNRTNHNNRSIILPPSTFNFILDAYELSDAEILKLFEKGEVECSNCSSNIPMDDMAKGVSKSMDGLTHFCGDCCTAAESSMENQEVARYLSGSYSG